MHRLDWREFISIDSEIHHGDPCIKGTRVPVSMILGSLADGLTVEEILTAYPQLSTEAIRASFAYASEMMSDEIFMPMG